MPYEAKDLFYVLEMMYRRGGFSPFLQTVNEALVNLEEKQGIGLDVFINSVNEISDTTLQSLEMLLKRYGFLLHLARNETIIGLLSRSLRLGPVRRSMVSIFEWLFVRIIDGGRITVSDIMGHLYRTTFRRPESCTTNS